MRQALELALELLESANVVVDLNTYIDNFDGENR